MDKTQILETIKMVRDEHLDIRTITMGISLLDCVSDDHQKASQRIYDKITNYAQDLVKTADDIEDEYGIPITNKRISITPVSLVAGNANSSDMITYAKAIDRAGKEVGVDFVGGFSALVQKEASKGDENLIDSLPQVLTETDILNSSINIGSTKAGINMDAVAKMGKIIKEISSKSVMGNSKLVVFANAVEDNPFMAGAFHGVSEGDSTINIGISGPGVVKRSIERLSKSASIDQVYETIKKNSL